MCTFISLSVSIRERKKNSDEEHFFASLCVCVGVINQYIEKQ